MYQIISQFFKFTLVLLLASTYSFAKSIPFDNEKWEIKGKESRIEQYLGRNSLYLKGGKAIVRDFKFTNGIIEYDVAFDGKRGFNGVMWRMQNSENYEKFYIRSHQSGNPDANQYTPVLNDLSAWQLYYSGNGYGNPYKYPKNKWIHVKIVVSGEQGEVYIENMDKPLFFINEMKTGFKSGKVGLVVEMPFLAPAYFSNFSCQNLDKPVLNGKAEVVNTPAGTINRWNISNPFAEVGLKDKFTISQDLKESLTWKKMDSEKDGILNIAKFHKIEDKKNTVMAKTVIYSDKEQIKKISFGFSSRIKLFLNDQLLFSGQDAFRSRDYRFLGTVGYYDDVYLSLKKGKNELWLAISEDMQFRGGWGFKAKIENSKGISTRVE